MSQKHPRRKPVVNGRSSEEFRVNQSVIVRKILEFATNKKVKDLEPSTLKNQLDKCLEKKRFLLVLDDVWNEEGEKWDRLKSFLVSSGAASGSKIIVTTRSIKVAEITSTLPPHVLQGLSQDESWSLLVHVALKGIEPENKRVIKTGKEIVERCCRVPLAIKTIGRVLLLKNPESEWSDFVKNEFSKVPQSPTDILPTLKLSYDYLPSHLKRSFAYCSLFPKGYEFDVKTLIHLWISQGFVESNSGQCLEEIGLEYVWELTWGSFFQELKRDALGNVESFKMHDLMNDLANEVGGIESCIITSNENNIDEKTHHVSFEVRLGSSGHVPAFLLKAKRLRTILLLSPKSSDGRVTFSNLRRLRVLDLHDLGIENLSPFPFIKKRKHLRHLFDKKHLRYLFDLRNLFDKKHLRYLDVSENYEVKLLPNSVTKLPNLQVLKLSYCDKLKELPRNIRKLINLRHLYIDGCRSLTHMPKGIGELTSLQTLASFIVAKDSSVSKHIASLKELGRLNELRGGIEIRKLGYVKRGELEPGAKILEQKKHLQSLTLRWDGYDDGNSRDDESLMQSLQPHSNLKELSVVGYGGVSFPSWLSSLQNLVHLTIEDCNKYRSLPLDHFPCLENLCIWKLDNLEYIESEDNHFPSLKYLWIFDCPKLEGWRKGRNNSDGAATNTTTESVLTWLEFRNCANLKWVPLIPSVTGKLCFRDVNFKSLQQTVMMKMNVSVIELKGCEGCKIFPPLDQIHSLKELLLSNVKDLEYIDSEADGQSGSKFYPSLKKLKIKNCPELKGWRKKKMDDDDDSTDAITAADLPQFPNLSELKIRHCPNLSCMPLFPSLDEKLHYEESGIEPLLQTMRTTTKSVKHIGPQSFTNLKELHLFKLEDLEYIDCEEENFSSEGKRGAIVFPSLKILSIRHCPNLKGWWKMGDNGRTTTTVRELPHFPSLSLMGIIKCPKLALMPFFPSLDDKLMLEDANTEPLKQTLEMTTWGSSSQPLSRLVTLIISEIEDLESLPTQRLKNLTSLQHLFIKGCPRLASLPQEMSHLISLELLDISACPLLIERCRIDGEDWSKIAHIPKIKIDSLEI